jgi:hypothetical protein
MCCGNPADPESRLTMHEAVGFLQTRLQGGANHLAFRRTTSRVLCADCSQRYSSTGDPRQADLFGGGVAAPEHRPPPLRDWDWLPGPQPLPPPSSPPPPPS